MVDLVVVDATIFCFCIIVLNRQGRLSHSHPAVIYLIFHFLVVTFRLWALANGADPIFRHQPGGYQPPSITELRRAVVLCDLALASFTAGCIQGQRVGARLLAKRNLVITYRPLSERILRVVSFVALPIGIWGVLNVAGLPGSGGYAFESKGIQSSSYVIITFAWGGLALLALVYFYGFRRWLVVPLSFYLLIAAVQGGLRFRFVIPVILLMQISLDRRGRRWPSTRSLLLGLVLLPMFFPLKAIGEVVQNGGGIQQIIESSKKDLRLAASGANADQTILDQFAITLSLVDEHNRIYLGQPYLAVITLPVPRLLWPGKPGLADYLKEISTPRRPVAELGMVTTIWGDAYLNFWYAGVILIPYLLGRLLTRFYVSAYRLPYHSVVRFAYLLVACNLILVFRDGIISLPVFILVQMMPLTAVLIWHRIAVPRRPIEPGPESLHFTAGIPTAPLSGS